MPVLHFARLPSSPPQNSNQRVSPLYQGDTSTRPWGPPPESGSGAGATPRSAPEITRDMIIEDMIMSSSENTYGFIRVLDHLDRDAFIASLTSDQRTQIYNRRAIQLADWFDQMTRIQPDLRGNYLVCRRAYWGECLGESNADGVLSPSHIIPLRTFRGPVTWFEYLKDLTRLCHRQKRVVILLDNGHVTYANPNAVISVRRNQVYESSVYAGYEYYS